MMFLQSMTHASILRGTMISEFLQKLLLLVYTREVIGFKYAKNMLKYTNINYSNQVV